jgi:hypothetical protein
MKTEEDEAFEDIERRQGGGFPAKRAMAADKQEPWNEDEWRRNNWRCGHGWLRGEQCEICNAAKPAQETVSFPCCGYTDAIKWNPFNGVVQCHMCGQIYTAAAKPAHCQCPACKDGVLHASDCAVHNGPAYSLGPCDCGATLEQEEDWGALAEKQLASIKRDTQASFEDAMVRATHKVMTEFEAQPVQEPVAKSFEEYCKTLHPLWNTHISRTYAEQFFNAGQAAQPAQPVQRPWVGLTDEEIASIPLNEYTLQIAERLLRDKNT